MTKSQYKNLRQFLKPAQQITIFFVNFFGVEDFKYLDDDCAPCCVTGDIAIIA